MRLIEQFLLKGENGNGSDRLYRQSKIPSLMLVRLKVLVNFEQDFQKGLETAAYLVRLSGESRFSEEEPVSME